MELNWIKEKKIRKNKEGKRKQRPTRYILIIYKVVLLLHKNNEGKSLF